MTIRITHDAGVGFWPCGAVVEIEDHRATRLIRNGYAVPEEPRRKPKRT